MNAGEEEQTLEERLKNPLLRQPADFTEDEERAALNKEMKSMVDFEEASMSQLIEEQLQSIISTRWVKVRKADGTCRCRIVAQHSELRHVASNCLQPCRTCKKRKFAKLTFQSSGPRGLGNAMRTSRL